MALGPEIIMIVSSKPYYDARWVIPPVACAIFFKMLYPLFSTVEFYYEKTGFVMIASSIAAAANVILNYIFIRKYGYLAAGYTTLGCYILYSAAHYVFQKRIAREHNIDKALLDMRYIVILSMAMLAVMIIMLFLYPHPLLRYILCMAAAVGFAVMFRKNRELFIKSK